LAAREEEKRTELVPSFVHFFLLQAFCFFNHFYLTITINIMLASTSGVTEGLMNHSIAVFVTKLKDLENKENPAVFNTEKPVETQCTLLTARFNASNPTVLLSSVLKAAMNVVVDNANAGGNNENYLLLCCNKRLLLLD
jgi:hypothetical protein